MASSSCGQCHLKIGIRQHKLSCTLCHCSYHRIGCIPKLTNSDFFEYARTTWTCHRCSQELTQSSGSILQTQSSNSLTNGIYSPLPPSSSNYNQPQDHRRNVQDNFNLLTALPFSGPRNHNNVHNDKDSLATSIDLNNSSSIDNIGTVITSEPAITKAKGFKFAHLNINSLRHKVEELQIEILKYKVSVMIITESKLNNSDITSSLMIPGYNIARFDNPTKQHGGGIVVYVSQTFAYEFYDINVMFPKIKFPIDTEVKVAKIKPPCSKPIILIVIYKPPHVSQLKKFTDMFKELIEQLNKLQLDIICAGDFNIDFASDSNTKYQLINISKTYGLKQVISEPTRVTEKTSTLLDHFYVPYKDNYRVFGNISVGFSDHDLIYVVKTNIKPEKLKPKAILCRNWTKLNSDIVIQDIKELDWSFINNNDDVDQVLSTFNEKLLTIVDAHVPLRKHTVRGHSQPWITRDIIQSRKERDKHLTKLKKIGKQLKLDPNMKCIYDEQNSKYKLAKNKTNNLINSVKKSYFNNEFLKSQNPTDTWNTMNKLTNFRKRNKQRFISLKNKDNVDCVDDNSIAEALSDVFLIPDNIKCKPPSTQDILNTSTRLREEKITSALVLQSINLTKPVSIDNNEVPPFFIKSLAGMLVDQITQIFNLSLSTGKYPTIWKQSLVTPLYKGKGKMNEPGNYRPIANTPFLSKVYERILKQKISTHLINNNLLNQSQHGYRRGRSCHTALKVLTDFIYKNIDKRCSRVPVVFVDFSKAFDCVDHNLLIKKLISEFKLSADLITILQSYLRQRSIKIKVNDTISKDFPVKNGVPQGSILGPLLFTLFINEIELALNLEDVHLILYADDLAIYTYDSDINNSIERLNQAMCKLDSWSKSVGLFMNYKKTEYMIFHKSKDTSKIPDIQISCNEIIIDRVYEFKYLGILLDPGLTFSKYFDRVESKISLAIGRVNALKRKITTKVFKQLLNSYVLSNIDFCLTVWAIQPKSQFENLQTKINRLIQNFFNPKSCKSKFTRIIASKKYKDIVNTNTPSTIELWDRCDMHSILERINYYLLLEVHKTIHRHSLPSRHESYISEMSNWFIPKQVNRSNRYEGLLELDSHASQTFQNSFVYRAISIWNKMIIAGNVFDKDYCVFKKSVALWVTKDRYSEYLFY